MTPLPHPALFEALNAALIERCRARRGEHTARHAETIGERLERDLAVLSRVPEGLFEPCEKSEQQDRQGEILSSILLPAHGRDRNHDSSARRLTLPLFRVSPGQH